ncbi:unnamed protein product [Protopolystoma xenopodis]|uniref:Uncharacterized protein n=1 Tax=Protopolystoma xenopodis TaxID=117903 RepID=A0A3S5CGM5_9PLAT|nr:unnamed protein product [Protopolystoma xenopodis]
MLSQLGQKPAAAGQRALTRKHRPTAKLPGIGLSGPGQSALPVDQEYFRAPAAHGSGKSSELQEIEGGQGYSQVRRNEDTADISEIPSLTTDQADDALDLANLLTSKAYDEDNDEVIFDDEADDEDDEEYEPDLQDVFPTTSVDGLEHSSKSMKVNLRQQRERSSEKKLSHYVSQRISLVGMEHTAVSERISERPTSARVKSPAQSSTIEILDLISCRDSDDGKYNLTFRLYTSKVVLIVQRTSMYRQNAQILCHPNLSHCQSIP